MAYTNNQPENKHKCEIILISKDLSVDEHSAEVHCHFEDYDKMLLPGMYMNAEIEVKSNEALTIPEEAVVTFEGKEYIFARLDQKNFKLTEVTTGNSENGFIEILNGESLKDKTVVTKGAYTLLMKLKNKSDE